MEIKYTLLGLLVYAAMLLWLLALGLYFRTRRGGSRLFAGGFLVLAAAFVLRWIQVRHAPLQNMFEVMLTIAMLMYPFWLLSQKFLLAQFAPAAVILGLIILVPVGFRFSADPQHLPPALNSWLFIPHVASYMLAYAILGLAMAQAILQLITALWPIGLDGHRCEEATYRLIGFGFPLLTLGLVLGAVWGQLAWSDYWQWDPKELWSLTTLLAYLAYFHFRNHFGKKYMRANAVLAIVGGACVIITLLWVSLSSLFQSMHNYAS